MKKITFLIFFFSLSLTAFSQKFGYVDLDFVLNKMPDYKKAQDEINRLSLSWQDEVRTMNKKVEGMYAALQAEEVLLTKEMKAERESEIKKKEEEVKEYQKKVFGFEGMLFLKKKELIKPVQDKVFEAVEKVAKEHRLGIIFDKSGGLVMIYTDPVHDYTDYVLEQLGLGDPVDTVK